LREVIKNSMRSIISILLLVVTVAWIILSYIPKSVLSLPNLTIGEPLTTNSPLILGIILTLFIGIQLVLISSIWKMFRREPSSQHADEFNLRAPNELFWSVLPLVSTIILTVVIILR